MRADECMNMVNDTKRPSIREILAIDEFKNELSEAGMSEQEVADFLGPIAGLSSGLFQLTMKAGDALGKTLNLGTRKKMEKAFSLDYALTVRAIALALESLGHKITMAFDTSRGSFIEATLPIDIFSLGGSLSFEIVEEGTSSIQVIGQAEIKGQLFDWGKSRRVLNGVFEKVERYANLLRS